MEVAGDGRAVGPLRRPGPLTAEADAVVAGGIFIVFMLNCSGTSKTKVDNVIIVFHSISALN